MANFFEQELRTLMSKSESLSGETYVLRPTYVGRAAFLALSGNRRARLEFITTGTANSYSALQITILNKEHGKIDQLTLHFIDYFKPQINKKIIPHIWVTNGKAEWYGTPSTEEINALAKAAQDYIDIMR